MKLVVGTIPANVRPYFAYGRALALTVVSIPRVITLKRDAHAGAAKKPSSENDAEILERSGSRGRPFATVFTNDV